jgi:hypothetical protein
VLLRAGHPANLMNLPVRKMVNRCVRGVGGGCDEGGECRGAQVRLDNLQVWLRWSMGGSLWGQGGGQGQVLLRTASQPHGLTWVQDGQQVCAGGGAGRRRERGQGGCC